MTSLLEGSEPVKYWEILQILKILKYIEEYWKILQYPNGSRIYNFQPITSTSIDSTRDLQALFPNSFNCIGDILGEHNIKTEPKVLPVQHVKWKVPIEYKEETKISWKRWYIKESSPNRLSPHHGSALPHTLRRQMATWGYVLTQRTWTKPSSVRITRLQPSWR